MRNQPHQTPNPTAPDFRQKCRYKSLVCTRNQGCMPGKPSMFSKKTLKTKMWSKTCSNAELRRKCVRNQAHQTLITPVRHSTPETLTQVSVLHRMHAFPAQKLAQNAALRRKCVRNQPHQTLITPARHFTPQTLTLLFVSHRIKRLVAIQPLARSKKREGSSYYIHPSMHACTHAFIHEFMPAPGASTHAYAHVCRLHALRDTNTHGCTRAHMHARTQSNLHLYMFGLHSTDARCPASHFFRKLLTENWTALH